MEVGSATSSLTIMKHFIVKVSAYIPYPKTLEYKVSGGRFAIAIKRAIDNWHQDTV